MAEPARDIPNRTMAERYDAAADRYARWWGPVLERTALRLLDTVEGRLTDPPADVLDVGTGTGVLAIDAVRRWPTARVVGIDGSRGMLEVAAQRATDRLPPADRDRLGLEAALAERLPHEPASFDLLVSSFVYQLVPNRYQALLEARRVLRPGGMLAYVTWQDDDARCLPQEAFDEAVLDARIEEDEVAEEIRSGDLPSAAAAAAQLRRAGFRSVEARTEWLDYRWTRDSYLEFVEQYDEWDLFSSIDGATRARLRRHARARFARLRPTDFHWRTPVIVAIARRPPGG